MENKKTNYNTTHYNVYYWIDDGGGRFRQGYLNETLSIIMQNGSVEEYVAKVNSCENNAVTIIKLVNEEFDWNWEDLND